ncbi:MAG: PAS domain S-box protein [Gemmatimonadales bacterium]
MEDNQEATEVRLRAAIESSPSGLLMVDSDGTIVLVNRQVESLFGYTREELLGKPIDVLIPQRYRADHPGYRRGFMAAPRTRAMGQGRDLYGLHKNGTEIPVEIGLNPIVTAEGLFVVSSIVDIRARRRAEARFRAAVDSCPNGMIMTDDAGTILLVNREVERLFGYHRDELLGQPVEQLVPERFRRGHTGFRHAFLRAPEPRPMGAGRDLYGLRKDGTEVPVEIGLTPVTTDEGTFILSAVVDISARKEAELALRKSVEHFRLLVDGVRDYALVLLDLSGDIVSWNEGAENLFGFPAERILGQRLTRLYPSFPDHPRADLSARLRIARELGRHEEETQLRRQDGTEFRANVVITALRDHGGHPRGFALVTRDVTERRKLEEQLRQAQKMEAIGTLAGGVAHDFNNILSAIIGYAELIHGATGAPESVKADAAELLTAADRGREMIERILAFSRRDEQKRRPLDLGAAVNDSLKLLRATLPSTIQLEARIDQLHQVFADPSAISQVLLNLVTNSAQAMPDGGLVEIALENTYVRDHVARENPDLREGPYALLTVRDQGGGIDPSLRERVFEPFFTTKGPGQGTGLGLAMVHTVMQSHEGTVRLDSEPGRGTTVRCFFPALPTEPTGIAELAEDIPPGQGERVLYLDDEPSLARLGERRLASLGYHATVSIDPETALSLFRVQPDLFDLVITDYSMPGMTGLAFAELIRAIRPDVPIIMLTGFVEDADETALKTSGIDLLLRKPVSLESLGKSVRETLDRIPG